MVILYRLGKECSYNNMVQNTSNQQNQSDDQLGLIARTVVDNSQRLDRIEEKVLEHDDKLDLIAKKVLEHDDRFDRITKKVLEHDDRFDRIEENMATKEDLRSITDTLDEILGLVKKNDQELTFMGERVTRVEEDIATMKPLVGLA